MIAIVIVISSLTVFPTTGVAGKTAVTNVPVTTAYVGTSVTVQCPYRSSSCAGIQWQKSNESASTAITSNSQQKYEFTNGCGLVIKDVRKEDALYYQCTISGSSAGIFLFVFQSQPSCTTTPPDTDKEVAEDDKIQYMCDATVYGIGQPQVKWYGKDAKLAEGQPQDNSQSYRIRGTLSTVAKAPKVQTLVCYASFVGKQPFALVKVCETKEFDILYSPRNVSTRPSLSVGPGEKLTCRADANPPATFQWSVNEDDASQWKLLAEGETVVAELKNGTSFATYKCKAWNKIRGETYEKESPEVTLTKHGKAIRIAIIVTVCVVVPLVIIAGLIVWRTCPKFCPSST